jgi:hypothetical protein
MATYTIASEEGAIRYGGQVGDEVELDLPREEETAVVAAGWLEPTDKKTKEAKK